MGTNYDQLTESERGVIARLYGAGRSRAEIARTLCRHPTTIGRELRRNSQPSRSWSGGYDAKRAQHRAERRRYMGRSHKLALQPALRDQVSDSLAMGWSPAQIAGRLKREHGRTLISHESIYRFIYHRSAQKDYWHRLLPRAKHRRGRPGRKGGSAVDLIRNRVSFRQRPAEAEHRRQPGHWEADCMLFRKPGHILLVILERSSRFAIVVRQPSRAAEPTRDSLLAGLQNLPPDLRRTITFDNGSEFARHFELVKPLSISTFFCDAHAPWQKGAVENAIGRLRRFFPRRKPLDELLDSHIDALVYLYNHTPRKCLAFQTPHEVFSSILNNVALET